MKMKKIKFNLVLLLTGFVFLQSCTKDLDVISTDPTVLSPDALYSSTGGYKKGLAGVYGNLSLTGTGDAGSSFLQGVDAGTSQFGRCLWYLQNLTTDEVIWSYENDGGVRELQRNIWTASNPILLGMFSRTMASVALSNEFLRQSTPEKLSARGVSVAEATEIGIYRNEVRALRAFAYYNMMDLFGKAPLVLESDPVNAPGPEYGRKQLFDYIQSELNAVLPNLKAPRANEYGRVDKAFAWAILAKMYLNAEVYINTPKYAECLTMCSNIISGGYTLKLNYLDNFKADNHKSSELIFTLQSDGVVTQNYGATTVMCNGQVGSIEGNGVALYGVGGWGGALRLRKQFVEKFDGSAYDSDARKTLIGAGRPRDITNVSVQAQGFVLGKYSNRTSMGVAGSNSTFVDTDFPLFRLADFYLMYAEAQMRKDGATNANNNANANATSLGYINALRERANDGSSANLTTSQATLNFILDERSRELHWEGHRRQDLIRFNKYTGGSYNWAWKGNVPNGTALSANYSLFPLPAPSLAANLNLTQNPGY